MGYSAAPPVMETVTYSAPAQAPVMETVTYSAPAQAPGPPVVTATAVNSIPFMQAFDIIDSNKDGIITRSELDANVVIPDAPDGSDAKREAFDIIDTKKDGFITRSEFSHHVMGGTNNASFVTAAPPQVFETPKTETKKDK